MKLRIRSRSDWSVIRLLLPNVGLGKEPNSSTFKRKPYYFNKKLKCWGKNLRKKRGSLINKISIWIWWARKNKSLPMNATNCSQIWTTHRCQIVPLTDPHLIHIFLQIYSRTLVYVTNLWSILNTSWVSHKWC